MGKITYTRGTSYYLTVNYIGPYNGVIAVFTAKNIQNDSDATDTTNAIFAPKSESLTGSGTQSCILKIAPGDVSINTAAANNYYYSVKVTDSNGDEYMIDDGTFVLNAYTTNEV